MAQQPPNSAGLHRRTVFVDTQPRPAAAVRAAVAAHGTSQQQQQAPSKHAAGVLLPSFGLVIGLLAIAAGLWLITTYPAVDLATQLQPYVRQWAAEHSSPFASLSVTLTLEQDDALLLSTPLTRIVGSPKPQKKHTKAPAKISNASAASVVYQARDVMSALIRDQPDAPVVTWVQLLQPDTAGPQGTVQQTARAVPKGSHTVPVVPRLLQQHSWTLQAATDPSSTGGNSSVLLGTYPFMQTHTEDAASARKCRRRHKGVWVAAAESNGSSGAEQGTCHTMDLLERLCVRVLYDQGTGQYRPDRRQGVPGCDPQRQHGVTKWRRMALTQPHNLSAPVYLPTGADTWPTVELRHGEDPEGHRRDMQHDLRSLAERQMLVRATGGVATFLGCCSCLISLAALGPMLTGWRRGARKSE